MSKVTLLTVPGSPTLTSAPALSIVSYLLFYSCFGLGVYLIPQTKPTKLLGLRQLLDSTTVFTGSALIIWSLWIAPLLQNRIVNTQALSTICLLAICNLTLIASWVDLLFHPRSEQPREPLWLLGFGCLLLIFVNFSVNTQFQLEYLANQNLLDYLWMVVCVIGGLVGVLQATAVKAEVEEPVQQKWVSRSSLFVRTALPSMLLLLTYTFVVLLHREDSHRDFLPLAWGVGILIALVSLRQLLTIFENVGLSEALRLELGKRQQAQTVLQQSNDILEQCVAERTKEVSILNEQLFQNEHQLRYDAFHDKLTSLPNRAFFASFVQYALHVAETTPNYHFAVLFLDFDSFKVINDSLGHYLGDKLLVALAQRLVRCVTSNDLVARLGGDEFVVMLTGDVDIHTAQAMADQLQAQFHLPFDIDGHKLFTSASIGIVMGDLNYTSADDILRDADIAMYKAKGQGKAISVIFDASMRESAIERLRLETELRDAMLSKQLYLHFQPIFDLESQQVTGFEALVRWLHPKRGNISPLEFIPLAEETGLIIPIGEWVLEEACEQMRNWQLMFPQVQPLTVSVNISPYQFRQSNLVSVVERTLRRVGLSPSCLKLEITESAFMHDTNSALTSFARLKALGVQLQLDDFGTGYSSLSYLHRMPISTIKIDRSFVSCIDHEGQNVEIARTITTLAHNLSMNVIAEGVETEAQMEYIRALGCEQIQGYLISKPLDKGAAERFIVQNMADKGYVLPLWKSLFDQTTVMIAA
ncbi:MAG: bifunctional diguanylate cyclase/phosphodiesterase [Caldilineaceae bacterium]